MSGIPPNSLGLPDPVPALALESRHENPRAQVTSLPPSEWFISYAQNGEDVLLNRVFRDVTDGFYVDIGAYDPEIGSVTKAFYERGWTGINIEPGPLFSKLAEGRPRDTNLRLAVWDYSGHIVFWPHPVDLGLSGVVPSHAGGEPGRDSYTVPCETLENILAAHACERQPDFIKIDAEGAEAAIINSTSWRTVRPLVLVVEATLPWTNQLVNEAWEKHLSSYGYRRVYFDGINCFYVPEERADLKRHFVIPVNPVDTFVRFDPEVKTLRVERDESRSRAEALQSELAGLREECGAVRLDRDRVATDLLAALAGLDELRAAATAAKAECETLRSQSRQLSARLATAKFELDRVAIDRDRCVAELGILRNERDDLASQAAALKDLLGLELGRSIRLAAYAGERHRLSRELSWPRGPLAIRVVLPIAKLLRWLRGIRLGPVLPEETETIDTLARLSGGRNTPGECPPGPVSSSTMGTLEEAIKYANSAEFVRSLENRLLRETLAKRAATSEPALVQSPEQRTLSVRDEHFNALQERFVAEIKSLNDRLEKISRLLETSVTTLALNKE